MENVAKSTNSRMIGKNNPRWSGGKGSYYKNHYQLKLNRLEKLKQTKGKCEICPKEAYMVHHKDGDKNNHNLSNLAALCVKHHRMVDAKGLEYHTEKGYSYYIRSIIKKYAVGNFTVKDIIEWLQKHCKVKIPSQTVRVIVRWQAINGEWEVVQLGHKGRGCTTIYRKNRKPR